jgi:hypothetical protein
MLLIEPFNDDAVAAAIVPVVALNTKLNGPAPYPDPPVTIDIVVTTPPETVAVKVAAVGLGEENERA